MNINTENGAMVIQRVSAHYAHVWIGSLFAGVALPFAAKVDLMQGDNVVDSISITDWKKPFSELSGRFFQLIVFENLLANSQYSLTFFTKNSLEQEWALVQQGFFSTLPEAIPREGNKPFTIALGSCFSNQEDNGSVSRAYAALYDKDDLSVKPDITFLVGDQVYLDIGFASLIPFAGFIRRRIANCYAKNWQSLAGIFTRGATWMLPDDHEYWNDYPFNNLPILALQALKLNSVRDVWNTTATEAVNNIQSAKMVECITIGDDLSICLANLRSERASNQFISEPEFLKLIEWAEHLTCPGVLVIQQLLMDVIGDKHSERNLPSFPDQYARLLKALASSGHDILVLTGDVHFGRVASVKFGTKGATLTEVVASPLSNLRGLLNGLAASVADNTPEQFPQPAFADANLPPQKVQYHDEYKVSHKEGRAWSVYPKPRTDEHFMTLSFSALESGNIGFSVNAWRTREVDQKTGLPSQGFLTTYTSELRKSKKPN